MDRNWNEMLQELRVTQTGTQILTGFLLAIAFQNRFSELDRFQHGIYLGAGAGGGADHDPRAGAGQPAPRCCSGSTPSELVVDVAHVLLRSPSAGSGWSWSVRCC